MAAKKDFLFDPDRNPLVREDYRPTDYIIPEANVRISLDDTNTVVHSRIWVKKNPDASNLGGGALVLDGENLKLKSLKIIENGVARAMDPAEYVVTAKNLIIKNPPLSPFALDIENHINPEANTSLSGLYKSGDLLCTQCEAQGFRRITYFLDRPDNLTKFTVSLSADKAKYPVLLSNGNGDYKAAKDIGNGQHSITWVDPHPKPSYLFAVVAGDMEVLEDTFTTMSGKKVDLRIFVQKGYEDKISWAMESTKRSMKWDEDRYGREYDLDCFHIVAVDKFNAGAMENKGLNVFNVKLLVGSPETSTDAELIDIEAVIGHEYFHNWTGDRVTLRDWFELTLKEGLTVLRDRQFTADMHSASIKTIDDATDLRAAQFMEDSGPTSHPIRPDIVEEFDNIYTGTIYEKGSHVLGMLHTMMGETTWRAAMDEYFNRFDGKAVACDDFLNVMEEVSGINLTQFRKWYSQSGTPEVSYSGVYDAAAQTYTLTLTQNTPPTHGQPTKEALHMPIAVGLIGQSGKDAVQTQILHLTKEMQTFVFNNVSGPVVPSVLRGFSAPVKITTQPSDDELVFRMAHDSDPFNKFEAAERLMVKTLHKMIAEFQHTGQTAVPQSFLDTYQTLLDNATDGDLAFNAKLLRLPAYNILTQDLKILDVEAVNTATHIMSKTLATQFEDTFKRVYAETAAPAGEKYDVIPAQVGRREMRNLALSFLAKLDMPDIAGLADKQFRDAENMTEKLGALGALARMTRTGSADLQKQALDSFYEQYKDNNNVVDKWLSLSASLTIPNAPDRVRELMKHEAYDNTNPNKVYALMGGFMSGNPVAFHKMDGSGYKLLADTIIELNEINPKTATNLAKRFTTFKRYSSARQELMIAEMKRVMETAGLDSGIKEILGKALETAEPKATGAKFDAAAKKP